MSDLIAVVMAAGLGKRMKSAVPKVLHPVAGRLLLSYPVRAALDAGARRVVCVVSPEMRESVAKLMARELPGAPLEVAVQAEPRGTGDAAHSGMASVDSERVLVLCGDTPLLRADEIRRLAAVLDGQPSAVLALMSCELDEPAGYGRVLRDDAGRVLEVREDRDLCTDAERRVTEVNAGVYLARTGWLKPALAAVEPNNAQGEHYLTDVVAAAAAAGGVVALSGHADALLGVNDRAQLDQAEQALYRRIARRHQLAGVTVRGDARIDDTVAIEPDACIEAGVVLRGTTRIGAAARLDLGSVITDSEIGPRAVIKPYSVITESSVAAGAQIGPFAHLRPGSEIGEEAHIGNFVETKKTQVHRGAKANHLAYLGDGEVGEGANVGAGTIFCNYDGYRKHRTVIGPGAFIGSDSQLVAPVTIGKNSYVATGTTVTRDVPEDALAIARQPQQNKEGYAPRLRARLAATKKNG